jgi:hypothetical protein
LTPKDNSSAGQSKGAAAVFGLLERGTPFDLKFLGDPKRHILLLYRLGRFIRGIAHLLRIVEADQVEEEHRAEPEDEHVEQQESRAGGLA